MDGADPQGSPLADGPLAKYAQQISNVAAPIDALLRGASLDGGAPALAAVLARDAAAIADVARVLRQDSSGGGFSAESFAAALDGLGRFRRAADEAAVSVRDAVALFKVSSSVFDSAQTARQSVIDGKQKAEKIYASARLELARSAAQRLFSSRENSSVNLPRFLAANPTVAQPVVAAILKLPGGRAWLADSRGDILRVLRPQLDGAGDGALPFSRLGRPQEAETTRADATVAWDEQADPLAYSHELLVDAAAVKAAGLPLKLSRGIGVGTVTRFRYLAPPRSGMKCSDTSSSVAGPEFHGVGASGKAALVGGSVRFGFGAPLGGQAVVKAFLPPGQLAKYNSITAPAITALLAAPTAERLRAMVPKWNDKRFYERLPLRAFLRVATTESSAALASALDALEGAPREERFAGVAAAVAGLPRQPPAWLYAAAETAFRESATIWQRYDRDKAPILATDEHVVRGSQVNDFVATFAPLFRARWGALLPAKEFEDARDPRLLATARLADAMSVAEKILGARRSDLLVFREPFALYAGKGLLT